MSLFIMHAPITINHAQVIHTAPSTREEHPKHVRVPLVHRHYIALTSARRPGLVLPLPQLRSYVSSREYDCRSRFAPDFDHKSAAAKRLKSRRLNQVPRDKKANIADHEQSFCNLNIIISTKTCTISDIIKAPRLPVPALAVCSPCTTRHSTQR